MIGRALALGLATLFLAAPLALADETPDSMGDVEIPEDRTQFAAALRELQEMSAEGGSFRLLGEYPA